jgi:tetratricopeptide (TPR) repeat protein
MGDLKGALLDFQRAVDIDFAALNQDPNNDKARSDVVVTLKNMGDLYYYQMSNNPEALRSYRKAAELLEVQAGANPGNLLLTQNLSEILTDIASILIETGQPQEAKVQAQRGLQLAKRVADQPGATGDQMYNYAWLAVTVDPEELRDPAGALPYAAKAVEMGKGQDPLCLHVLALAYAGTHDYRRRAIAGSSSGRWTVFASNWESSFCHETPARNGKTAPLRSRLGKHRDDIPRDLLPSRDRQGAVLLRRMAVSRQKLSSCRTPLVPTAANVDRHFGN